ncbi:MAG: protein kinase [Muribaculaceae bacterium]|nr:protein kinase [Muribaculaceae bacterium]
MASGLKKGTLLHHGMYRIERILGSGGFGITYLATDLGLERLRAIKEFFPKDYCDRDETTSHVTLGTSNTAEFVDKLKKKFIKEARNIANLDQHQGIITIHAVFEENNTAYYVMDYIEGENLSEIVKRDGPLAIEKAIKYITEVGNALNYVHEHHINHLDIKPANIMIRRKDDSPILIDFGLSKQYDSEGLQTSTTPTGISHGYAPFEQYKEGGVKEFSPQTDVYSLAATLYYIVSGKVPPHATDLIENPLSFPEGFPYFLKYPLSKAMSTKRRQRHETVKAFISSLKPEDVATVIEVPNRNRSLSTSENSRNGNIPVSENRNGSLQTSDKNNIRNKNNGNLGNRRRKYNFPSYFKKHKLSIVGLCITLVVITGGVLIAVFSSTGNSNPKNNTPTDEDVVVNTPKRVENLAYKSSLGLCSYTGEVDDDNLPNGHGIATWETGEGKVYDGVWSHGRMYGPANYIHSSGDTFKGTFINDEYNHGRYTISSTGEYFEGTFKNGQPSEGKWYDKNGKII